MKTWMKAVVCIVLSFSFLFITQGYAALTDNLTVTGTTKVDIPSGIYIIDMERSSSSRLDVEKSSYYSYSTTLDTSLSKSSRNQSGTGTYEITVFNNTVTLERSGGMESQLIIEKGRRHSCLYNTPEGDFVIGIFGESLMPELTENGGKLYMSYTIDVYSGLISKNIMEIKIKEI